MLYLLMSLGSLQGRGCCFVYKGKSDQLLGLLNTSSPIKAILRDVCCWLDQFELELLMTTAGRCISNSINKR
jgi:hypothetical protein